MTKVAALTSRQKVVLFSSSIRGFGTFTRNFHTRFSSDVDSFILHGIIVRSFLCAHYADVPLCLSFMGLISIQFIPTHFGLMLERLSFYHGPSSHAYMLPLPLDDPIAFVGKPI